MDNTTSPNDIDSLVDATIFGRDYRIYFTVCLVAFMPVIIFGNSLVLAAIATEKKLQTIPNMFVTSLAVGDLFVGLVVIPLYLGSYWDEGLDYRDMVSCVMKFSLIVLSCGGSLLSLMFVALDRYIAIVFPYKYVMLVTKRRAVIVIVGIWVYIVAVSSLPLFGWNKWSRTKVCEFFNVMEKSYTILTVLLTVSVTLLTTTYMYIHIFIEVYKQHVRMKKNQPSHVSEDAHSNQNPESTNQKAQEAEKRKSAKVMAVVYFLFVVFWLPYLLVSQMQSLITDKELMQVLKTFTLILAESNSGINPVVYAWMRMSFRRQFLRILGFKRYAVNPMLGET